MDIRPLTPDVISLMWKQLLFMIVVLLGLIAWDLSMSERTIRLRQESVRIERLFDAESVFSGERPIAAIRLDRGDGVVHLYVHLEQVWRCMTAHGALALHEDIDSILPKLIAAEGVIQTRNPQSARELGFDTSEMLTLSFCGPDVMTDPLGDVIYAIDIGYSMEETGGSFVRPVGGDEVWMIDQNLRAILGGDPDSPLPPMVDPHIVPAAWPGFRPPGVDRIVIEVPGRPPLELQRHEREVADEQAEAGVRGWEWSAKMGEREFEGHPFQIYSYGRFLTAAPYSGILSPRTQYDFGFDRPRGRITLRSVHGQYMQLIVGQQAPRGGVPVFNTYTQNRFEIVPDLVELLLPELDTLLADHLGNPWEPFTR